MTHAGQKRMNGQPYIFHPRSMAYISINEFYVHDRRVNVLIAVHDTKEQPAILFLNLGFRLLFDSETSQDRNLLTKTKKNKPVYVKRISESGNWRVMYVKLIDRLHNMRTLDGTPSDFQKKQAQETKEFFLDLCFTNWY